MKRSRVIILAAAAAVVAGLLLAVPRLASTDDDGNPQNITSTVDGRCLDQYNPTFRQESPIIRRCDGGSGQVWIPRLITNGSVGIPLLIRNDRSEQCMIATDLGTVRMLSACDRDDPAFIWRQQTSSTETGI